MYADTTYFGDPIENVIVSDNLVYYSAGKLGKFSRTENNVVIRDEWD